MGTVRKRDWLLNHLHTGDGLRVRDADAEFHLLTEDGLPILTETSAFIDIEH